MLTLQAYANVTSPLSPVYHYSVRLGFSCQWYWGETSIWEVITCKTNDWLSLLRFCLGKYCYIGFWLAFPIIPASSLSAAFPQLVKPFQSLIEHPLLIQHCSFLCMRLSTLQCIIFGQNEYHDFLVIKTRQAGACGRPQNTRTFWG